MKKVLLWLKKVAFLGLLAFFLFWCWVIFLFCQLGGFFSTHIPLGWKIVDCILMPATVALFIFISVKVGGKGIEKAEKLGKKVARTAVLTVCAVGFAFLLISLTTS